MLIAQAVNLLIFTSAGLSAGKPPIIDPASPASSAADPLPQALILTAIVISFGVLAFALVLVHRAYKTIGTDDLDRMKGSDE
jgi:multicomponent Na+:H+ antiporter subunit C